MEQSLFGHQKKSSWLCIPILIGITLIVIASVPGTFNIDQRIIESRYSEASKGEYQFGCQIISQTKHEDFSVTVSFYLINIVPVCDKIWNQLITSEYTHQIDPSSGKCWTQDIFPCRGTLSCIQNIEDTSRVDLYRGFRIGMIIIGAVLIIIVMMGTSGRHH